MEDIKIRNKQVKEILAKEFGRKNVSVTNGKGTAWGWCHIDILAQIACAGENISCNECAGLNNGLCKINNKPVLNNGWLNSARQILHETICNKVDELVKGIEFYGYSDDMGTNHKEYLTQVRFIK